MENGTRFVYYFSSTVRIGFAKIRFLNVFKKNRPILSHFVWLLIFRILTQMYLSFLPFLCNFLEVFSSFRIIHHIWILIFFWSVLKHLIEARPIIILGLSYLWENSPILIFSSFHLKTKRIIKSPKFYSLIENTSLDNINPIFNFVAFTCTFLVFSTAYVAKFIFASASHVIASFAFLHPEFAIRALLEFGSFHKEYEVFVFFPQICYLLVLFAGHICMERTSAP